MVFLDTKYTKPSKIILQPQGPRCLLPLPTHAIRYRIGTTYSAAIWPHVLSAGSGLLPLLQNCSIQPHGLWKSPGNTWHGEGAIPPGTMW